MPQQSIRILSSKDSSTEIGKTYIHQLWHPTLELQTFEISSKANGLLNSNGKNVFPLYPPSPSKAIFSQKPPKNTFPYTKVNNFNQVFIISVISSDSTSSCSLYSILIKRNKIITDCSFCPSAFSLNLFSSNPTPPISLLNISSFKSLSQLKELIITVFNRD